MAFPIHPDDKVHWWPERKNGFTQKPVHSGINWPIFRYAFEIAYSRYYLGLRNPWFSIQIASGAKEWDRHNTRWHGVRIAWNPPKGWRVKWGGVLFNSFDTFLSFRTYQDYEFNG